MPIYEYRCADCHQLFEEWQKNFEDKTLTCPVCGGTAERVMSNTSFVLKGGGWYVTEYGNRKQADGNGGHAPAPAAAASAPAAAPAAESTAASAPAPAAETTPAAPATRLATAAAPASSKASAPATAAQ